MTAHHFFSFHPSLFSLSIMFSAPLTVWRYCFHCHAFQINFSNTYILYTHTHTDFFDNLISFSKIRLWKSNFDEWANGWCGLVSKSIKKNCRVRADLCKSKYHDQTSFRNASKVNVWITRAQILLIQQVLIWIEVLKLPSNNDTGSISNLYCFMNPHKSDTISPVSFWNTYWN